MVYADLGQIAKAADDFLTAYRKLPANAAWEKPSGGAVLKEIVSRGNVFAELRRRGSLPPDQSASARRSYHFRRGAWYLAAVDAAEAVRRWGAAGNAIHLIRLAALQAWTRNRAGLRDSCQEILASIGHTEGSKLRYIQAIITEPLLAPGIVDDFEPIRKLADEGVAAKGQSSDHDAFRVIRALLDYRAGNYDHAAARLEQVSFNSEENRWWVHVGRITLAMARHQLGHKAEARQQLLEAGTMLRRTRPRIDRGQLYVEADSFYSVIPEVLLREAEELILDPVFPAVPFAP